MLSHLTRMLLYIESFNGSKEVTYTNHEKYFVKAPLKIVFQFKQNISPPIKLGDQKME